MNETKMTAQETEINKRAFAIREEIKRLSDDMIKNVAGPDANPDDIFLKMSANLSILNMLVSSLAAIIEMKLEADVSNLGRPQA